MGQQIQSAVFGATGYSGFELVRLLARHDGAKKPLLFSRNGDSAYKDLSEAYPQIAGNGGFPFESFSWERMKGAGVDVLFLATPHEFSRELVPEAIARGFRVDGFERRVAAEEFREPFCIRVQRFRCASCGEARRRGGVRLARVACGRDQGRDAAGESRMLSDVDHPGAGAMDSRPATWMWRTA